MSFPHAREGNKRTATGAIGIFPPFFWHACHSPCSVLKVVLLYIIIITELLANLLSQLSRSHWMGGKQSETRRRGVPP